MPGMVRIAVIVWCLAGPGWAGAEPGKKPQREGAAPAERPGMELTVEAIERRLKQIESASNLDESVRKGLIDKYNAALEHLKTAKEHAARAAEFHKATADAPKQLARLKTKMEGPRPDASPQIAPDMDLAEMQDALSQAEKSYDDLQKRLAELQREPERRAERRIEIPDLEQAAREKLEDIQKEHESSSAAESDPAAIAARVLLTAHRHALEDELKVYEEELRHYEVTGDLIETLRDHALVLTEHAEQHLKAWKAAVNDRREREADAETRAAQEAVQHAHPAIRRLAEENAALAAQRQGLAAQIEIGAKELEALQSQLDVLDALSDRVKERIKRVGLTESIGVLLRKQREAIPNIVEHQHFIAERKAEISKLWLQLVDLEDQREGLADIDERASRVLSDARKVRQPKTAPSEAEVRKTLETMRDYLDSLLADTNSYVKMLAELDTKESQLIVKAREFSDITREYILWIKSAGLPQPADAKHLRNAVGWLAAPRSWNAAFQAFESDVRTHPGGWIGTFVGLLGLVLSQRFWRNLLRKAGRDASGSQMTSNWPTGLALVATLLLSAVSPLVLWLAGWRLLHLGARTEFLVALARGLEGAAILLATLNVTRHLCRSFGLGEAHFAWPQGGLRLVRGSIWSLTAIGLPLAAIVLMTESQTDETIKNSLGRVAFVAFQALLLASAHRVWHGPYGLAKGLKSPEGSRWWIRLCRLGYAASFAAPIALAALAIVGYYYTAVQLAERLLVTAWLAGGILVVHACLERWLLLAYRDLAMMRGRERRAPESSARSVADREAESAESEPRVRLSEINVQTHKLLGLAVTCAFLVGCSAIWIEELPAFEILDTVQLWPRPFTIVDPPVEPDAAHYVLTLGELAIALLLGVVTVAAARNVPGLVEITVLRHLKLDSGARYAVDAVTRYTITILGMSMAFGRVGLGWKDVQWLVAAMTVGLGFGLQEIFANFASGLLLLFERPIRIGDTVSVGDIIGKVTRIRIRATTITDGDMRELIVPNKEFISGKVLNWTLSDTTSRMTVKVGVPHGSDPDLVRHILLSVAREHPLVLKEPPPHALFDEFADDKLNFMLRVYMGSRDVYNQLRHELNAGINAAFREAGIDKSQPPPDVPAHPLPHAA